MLTTLFWTVLLFFLRVYIFVNVKIILLSLRWIFSKNEAYRELGVNENGWIDFICVKIKSSFSHFRHGEIVLSTFHQFVLRLKLAWFRETSCEAEWQVRWLTKPLENFVVVSTAVAFRLNVSVVGLKVKIVYECYFLSAVCISERRIKWWPYSSSADSIRAAMHPFFLGCSN